MSMMGCFRELPPSVLARLQADPALVDDVVLVGIQPAGPGVSASVQEQLAAAVEGMKAAVMQSGDALLAFLPPEQRDAVATLPAEQKQAVFRELAEEVSRVKGWDQMITRGSRKPSVAQSELGKLLEIDKAWHGLHYLLTGSARDTEGPLGQAILGGTEIGDDGGYGPARYLLPDEVKAVSIALEKVADAELRNRYDASALSAANVYPGGWDDPETLEWLLEAFGELQSFYRGAAARGSAALLFIQ